MKAKLYQQDGTVKGDVELPQSIFDAEVNEPVLHQVIKLLLANQRQGTSKTKGRSEVSGGGRKPWRQKGTGRARAGSNTSPVWARGGKAHGPQPRDYYTNIPKKIRRLALTSALSSRARTENILVIDNLTYDKPQTKAVASLLKALSVAGKRNLLIVGNDGKNIYLSARNIKDVQIRPVNEINAYDIMASENIIFADENLIGKVKEAVVS
ncbi:MAG: 50S ribosomal protein L4 [Fibrobacter sp.]|jgi:large subunit ribosomal protein L4|nr:50S ribosomal protein L4 [Fibrobacter sp.]